MQSVPIIRDDIEINQKIQDFYDNFTGSSPVFLLGRAVSHAPGFVLRVGQRPLVIVADHYDGAGGMIDAGGEPRLNPAHDNAPFPGFSAPPANGAVGGNGSWPGYRPHPPRQGQPVGPGTRGFEGGSGGVGGPAGSITLLPGTPRALSDLRAHRCLVLARRNRA